jgi:dynein heavy chain
MANLNNILANRYVKAVRKTAEKNLQDVQLIMDIVEKWTEAQRKWMYLENIFAAPDIKKQMAQESRDFDACDKFIRAHVKRTNLNPKLIKLVGKANEDLLKKLTQNTEVLERIEKQLEQYLEGKRQLFPRFYFLSNDELLEILAKANLLEMVEQHLGKCFEGLVRLYMGEGRSTATSALVEGMISP